MAAKKSIITPWSKETRERVVHLLSIDVPVREVAQECGVGVSSVSKVKTKLKRLGALKQAAQPQPSSAEKKAAPPPNRPAPSTGLRPRSMVIGPWAIIVVNLNGPPDENMRAFLDVVKDVREGKVG